LLQLLQLLQTSEARQGCLRRGVICVTPCN
jgi:hypothetical protein